ncbi:MAG: lytic murein transglycosylase [Rhodobiaceae bacterium]|nr:lytic murein transglycosylase [Rhodobiaceae bacterium]
MRLFAGLGNADARGWRRRISAALGAGALAIALAVPGLFSTVAPAASDADFDRWIDAMWPQARAKGVSRQIYLRATSGLTPDPDVLKAADYQPEFVKPIWDYVARATSDKRVTNGREKLREYSNVLDAIETVYGVDRHIVVAIWGMETAYGEFLGDKNVIRALATLGYRGRRAKFGRSQMLAALEILQRGDTTPERMTGSWAGAMGHTQFIPTTYNAYAVDFDGDGRRDIWGTIADALASTANYLRKSRWQSGLSWGYEVVLPPRFNYALAGSGDRRVQDWAHLGVRRPGGQALSHSGEKAQLLLPAGAKGPAFLIFSNFRSILRYNNATAYALSVGLLADRLSGGGALSAPWPVDDRPLEEAERRELQALLAARGYAIGDIDGVLGERTRSAIRSFQKAQGMTEDGHAGALLFKRLKGN